MLGWLFAPWNTACQREEEWDPQQQGRLVQGLVRRKACEAQGCGTQPSFGFPGKQRRRCKAHAQEGMVSFTVIKSRGEHTAWGEHTAPGVGEAHVLQPASASHV